MEPGSSLSRFRHNMGAVSGWQCSDGEEGMEPGDSASRFRHYVGAVSGWQCSDEAGGSLRVLPTFELLLVAGGIARLSGSRAVSGGPPAVRWPAQVNYNTRKQDIRCFSNTPHPLH